MSAELDKLSIKIEVDSATAQAKLSSLANLLGMVTTIMEQMKGGSGDLTKALEKNRKALEKLNVDTKKSAEQMDKLGDATEKAGKKASINIARMAKTILIRKAIQAVLDVLKQGIDQLYEWDKVMGSNGLSGAMDELKSSVSYLGRGIATALSPVIQALTPLVTWLTDAIVEMCNKISWFFAVMSGASTYTKAKKVMDEYGASVTSTSKALKDLLGFDELNRLSDMSRTSASVDFDVNWFTREDVEIAEDIEETTAKIAQDVLNMETGYIGVDLITMDMMDAKVENARATIEYLKGLWNNTVDTSQEMINNQMAITDAQVEKWRKVIENWKTFFENVGEKISTWWTNWKSDFSSALAGLKTSWEKVKTWLQEKFPKLFGDDGSSGDKGKTDYTGTTATGTGATVLSSIIRRNSVFASGGFPTRGEVFIARESGAELVGSIGGRTAVANNDQIVAAVSQGVASAVASVMGGQNISLNVDGQSLFNIMVNRNNSIVRSSGASPLLV